MLIKDKILFRMPCNQEYQFPAMSVMQSFVNNFGQRCRQTDVTGGKADYELQYFIQVSDEDWCFFQKAGLDLKQPPEDVDVSFNDDDFTMIVDMTDDRIEMYREAGKHVAQVCGIMSGVSCPPLPKLRTVKVNAEAPFCWIMAEGYSQQEMENTLLQMPEQAYVSGVVAPAGRLSYLATCMKVGVVEIEPNDRPRTWLSKYTSTIYRVVKAGHPEMIKQAVDSIEKELIAYAKWKQQRTGTE